MEQGVEQRVLQPQEEEDQNSLNQVQLRAVERQKESEADWEREQQLKGWELGKLQKEGHGDRAEEHQEVVGKEEEQG